MAVFRQTLLGMMWWIALLPATFFIVLTVSTFFLTSIADHGGQSPNQAPPPPPPPSGCAAKHLHDQITMWSRYIGMCLICSAACIVLVRIAVDVFDAYQQEDLEKEQKAYEKAQTEMKEAEREFYKAAQEVEDARYSDCVAASTLGEKQLELSAAAIRFQHVSKKAAQCKPKKGINRMPGWMRITVRIYFTLSVLSSFGACLCASAAFYLSLQLQIGCTTTWGEILTFALVAVIVAPVHVLLGWAAITQS